MNVLGAAFLAAAGLLAVAGLSKLRRPWPAARALRTQGLPYSPPAVRVLGAGELAVAAAALAGGTAGAWLLAAAYTAFTVFVLVPLLRGQPLSSCGCFGETDLPATTAHPVVTAAAAACAVAVATGLPAGLPALPASLPLAAGTCFSAAVVGWLAYVVLTGLPQLVAAQSFPAPPLSSASPSPRSPA